MYSEYIKIVVCLVLFSEQIHNIWVFFDKSVFETTALLNLKIYSSFLWLLLASSARSYRVTDEAFMADT